MRWWRSPKKSNASSSLKKTMMQLFGDFKHLFIIFIFYLATTNTNNTYNPDYQQSAAIAQCN